MNLVELLRTGAQLVATVVEAVGIFIVAVAVVLAAARYVAGLVRRSQPFPPEGLRLGLGRSLALSLEFLLGADILRTADLEGMKFVVCSATPVDAQPRSRV